MKLSHLIAQALWAAQYNPTNPARYVRVALKLSTKRNGACGWARELLGL